jgi:hypothetical protein
MTTIYVRIPRDRWTPIGDVDLWNGKIQLNPELAALLLKRAKRAEQVEKWTKKNPFPPDSYFKKEGLSGVDRAFIRMNWENRMKKAIGDVRLPSAYQLIMDQVKRKPSQKQEHKATTPAPAQESPTR